MHSFCYKKQWGVITHRLHIKYMTHGNLMSQTGIWISLLNQYWMGSKWADEMGLSRYLFLTPQRRLTCVNGCSSSAPVEICSEHLPQAWFDQCSRVSELSSGCCLHTFLPKAILLMICLLYSRREIRYLSRKCLIECFNKIISKCFPLDRSKGDHMCNSLWCQNTQFFDLVKILWCRRNVFQYLVCLLNMGNL